MFTDTFIGQGKVAEQVRVALVSARHRRAPFPHALFEGPPGLGKTLLAKLIANDMHSNYTYRVASAVKSEKDLVRLLTPLAHNSNCVVFLDEIEQLPRQNTELLHTVLEGNLLSTPSQTLHMKPCTIIGATNYVGELPRPFRDRFSLQLEFQPYTREELDDILRRETVRRKIPATDKGLILIGYRSRGVPRNAIRFLTAARDVSLAYKEFEGMVSRRCVLKMFELNGVDVLGLTEIDRRILQALNASSGPLGVRALAQAVNEDISTVEAAEGFLIRMDLLRRTPKGRILTDAGAKHLGKGGNS